VLQLTEINEVVCAEALWNPLEDAQRVTRVAASNWSSLEALTYVKVLANDS
jgi:hypothetical protein